MAPLPVASRAASARKVRALSPPASRISIAVATIRSFESASARRCAGFALVAMSTILTCLERCSKLAHGTTFQSAPEGGAVMTAPVTIIGAGLGGLVLARVLHVRGIPATIYESEPAAQARTQGGQLDIHENNGQLALEAAGLTSQFRAIIHEGGQATRMLDPHGAVLLDQPDDDSAGRPEVLRGDLRQILIDSLPAGTIQWGRKLTDAAALGDGRHELAFADGTA